MEVKIYTSKGCPHCTKLKRILSILMIKFNEIDVDLIENEKEYEEIASKYDNYYIPAIKIEDKILLPERDFKTMTDAAGKVFKILKKMR